MSTTIAHRDAATASLYAGYIGSIERDPGRWDWPDSTAAYLRHRVADLAAGLVGDGVTGTAVAA